MTWTGKRKQHLEKDLRVMCKVILFKRCSTSPAEHKRISNWRMALSRATSAKQSYRLPYGRTRAVKKTAHSETCIKRLGPSRIPPTHQLNLPWWLHVCLAMIHDSVDKKSRVVMALSDQCCSQATVPSLKWHDTRLAQSWSEYLYLREHIYIKTTHYWTTHSLPSVIIVFERYKLA